MITAGEGEGSPSEMMRQRFMVSQKRHIRQWGLWETEEDGQEVEDRTKRTRAGRALRNRKYRRLVEDAKKKKRLFTPEIKKFLKGWLIRRRKNPYPNRSEKRDLALKTGLTYMQICNWFANWRRKLKKSCRQMGSGLAYRETWGPLITGYNRQAQGNVEQFSISSDDSIWDEANYNLPGSHSQTTDDKRTSVSHPPEERSPVVLSQQRTPAMSSAPFTPKAPEVGPSEVPAQVDTPVLLKWLESAARFRPREPWSTTGVYSWSTSTSSTTSRRRPRLRPPGRPRPRPRHREELDAAEALTFLSASSGLRVQGQCV